MSGSYIHMKRHIITEGAPARLAEIAAKYGITAPAHAIEDMLRSDWEALSIAAHALHRKHQKDGAFYVVITGHYRPAIEDFGAKMKSFDPARMKGVMRDGRGILFVTIDRPDRMYGLEISGYEVHRTAYDGQSELREHCVDIAISRMRKATP